jgi:tocopherol O-methyltransferase
VIPSPEAVSVESIRRHYDGITFLYRQLWGEHIHHGYWEANEAPKIAQEKLIEKLAEAARIPTGARVLDVGCGVGGSSIWLATRLRCSVLGITLSPVQAAAANKSARKAKVESLAEFRVMDANALNFPDESFDVVWIVECSEHLADKAAFFRACANLLRPGGRLALSAWLAGPAANSELVQKICDAMLCPSLGTMSDYQEWMESTGLRIDVTDEITPRVKKTWEICERIGRRPEVKAALRVLPSDVRRFVESFAWMNKAYESGAMSYGMFTARKSIC